MSISSSASTAVIPSRCIFPMRRVRRRAARAGPAEGLRQPLEERRVMLARSLGSVDSPACFTWSGHRIAAGCNWVGAMRGFLLLRTRRRKQLGSRLRGVTGFHILSGSVIISLNR
jgi:hypothetical protein